MNRLVYTSASPPFSGAYGENYFYGCATVKKISEPKMK
jgi:hypothetical protein